MQCIKCGEELEPGDKICLSCGEKVPRQRGAISTPGLEESAVRILLAVGGIASSTLLILAANKMFDAKSVFGTSFAAAYYEGIGWAMIGLACFTGPLLLHLALRK